MLTDKQQKKFSEFYDSARNNGVLESKTTLLLYLGAAMAVGCIPCMEGYLGAARKEGISDEEISAVQAAVMAVSAGRVSAQFRGVERKTGRVEKVETAEKAGGCCG